MSSTPRRRHDEQLPRHPILYVHHSREELLARIAELERAQAQKPACTPPSGEPLEIHKPVGHDDRDGAADSRAPATGHEQYTAASQFASSSSPPYGTIALTKAERKVLKKKARASSPHSRANGSGTGSLQGNSFFAKYATRKIAIRFSYEGWLYGGLALQMDGPPPSLSNSSTGPNALPTVEGVLLDALVAARLIKASEKRDMEALQFSRCGRTDRGVSAAGQVVSLYVRSQLDEEQGQSERGWRAPAVRESASGSSQALNADSGTTVDTPHMATESPNSASSTTRSVRQKPRGELPYMSLLNRALPSSIRVLGWSPVEDDFDARFSCQHRHYKYFFTAPDPWHGPLGSGQLDVRRMQAAADRLVGEHDFRNLCKVDATKQITNFYRHVMSAKISRAEVARDVQAPSSDDSPAIQDPMWVFDLKGSAFLYHQVRHIMAILFLVGNGNEDPSVVDALLNTGYANGRPITSGQPARDRSHLPIVASRPTYEMAGDLPLVLWDCAYPPEAGLIWRQDHGYLDGRQSKAYQEMEAEQQRQRLKSVISAHFMQSYLDTGNAGEVRHEAEETTTDGAPAVGPKMVHLGAGKVARMGKYTPLLQRPRSDPVETVNARWAEGTGKRRAERRAREASTA